MTLYPAATSIPEMIARLEALPRPPSIEDMWLFQPRQPDPHLLGLSIA